MSRLIFNAVLGGTTTLESTNSADSFLITVPAANGTLSLKDSSGDATFRNITLTGAVLAGAWNGSTIAVTYGGTGATTLTGYVKGNGTSAMTASATIPNTDITGLGTMSTQNANAVTITGGTISGLGSPLAVASGGSGATTLTGYVKGNGTSAMTASATIPNTDITGLGTMSTQNASSVAITGGTISGLGTPLAVASGGTGATSISGLVFGNGTSAMTAATAAQIVSAIGSTYVTNATNATNAVSATTATNIAGGASGSLPYQTASGTTSLLAKGTNGQVLSLVSGLPAWVSVSGAGTVTSVDGSGGTTGLTLTGGPITSSGTLTLGGTLAVANGGTNITSYATGDILYASASGVLSKLAAGTNGQVLTLASGLPSWADDTSGVTSFQTSLSGLTPSTSTTGAVTLAGTLGVASGGTGLTSVTANRIPYGNGTSALNTSANLTFDGTTLTNTGNAIISDNSANAALRITQVGAGNALLVEDSANPDATPFVVTSAGDVLVGTDTKVASYVTAPVQIAGANGTAASFAQYSWNVGANSSPYFLMNKSRGAAVGTRGIVSSGDSLGFIDFCGDDGASFIRAAEIVAQVDGTPGTNDMPGRLVFSTTADGASSPTERMRIDNAGQVAIGGATGAGISLFNRRNITGSANSYGFALTATIQTDVTGSVNGYFTNIGSAASTTIGSGGLTHYAAFQAAFGASTSITNQFGFSASNTLTGATNNYGFYGNIASGTGRWNFYAAGTADNYFAGNVGLGTTTPAAKLSVVGTAYSPNITLSDAATIAWDTSTGQVATFTFVSSNRTMGAPTNLKDGAFYALAVIQNGGSNTLTWNSVFKWAAGTAPTLSTAAGAKDYFTFRSDGTNLYQQGISQAVA